MEDLKKLRSEKLGSLTPQTNNQPDTYASGGHWRMVINALWGDQMLWFMQKSNLNPKQIYHLRQYVSQTYDDIQQYLEERYKDPQVKERLDKTNND